MEYKGEKYLIRFMSEVIAPSGFDPKCRISFPCSWLLPKHELFLTYHLCVIIRARVCMHNKRCKSKRETCKNMPSQNIIYVINIIYLFY